MRCCAATAEAFVRAEGGRSFRSGCFSLSLKCAALCAGSGGRWLLDWGGLVGCSLELVSFFSALRSWSNTLSLPLPWI